MIEANPRERTFVWRNTKFRKIKCSNNRDPTVVELCLTLLKSSCSVRCTHFFAFLIVFMARYRWTKYCEIAQAGSRVIVEPIVIDQKVLRTLGSGLKLKEKTNNNKQFTVNKSIHTTLATITLLTITSNSRNLCDSSKIFSSFVLLNV